MAHYHRLTENGFGNARFVEADKNIFDYVLRNQNVPWYSSVYVYNEHHKKQFDETNSVAGIRDVTTKMLWWDFDSKSISEAQKSTIELINRLLDYGFSLDEIQIRYSGSKGFHVVINTDTIMTPNQVEAIAEKFAGDIEGFDTSLYDANQVMRIPLTKHPKTGVYCTPITYDELVELTAEELKELASDVSHFDINEYMSYYSTAKLPKELLVEPKIQEIKEVKQDLTFDIHEVDFKNKPKGIDNARWLLMNGFFRGSETADVGERNYAFLCLASTYKNMGYDREVVLGLLSGVAELQARRTGETVFDGWELEHNIVDQVFSPLWKGGQFSIKDKTSWLYKYAVKMGIDLDDDDEVQLRRITDMANKFTNFVKNLERNTIKTGIEWLDEKMPIVIGSNVGIIGASGSGKTSWALDILSNTSKQGVLSVFISLDMNSTRMFEKVLKRVTGLSSAEIYHKYKTGKGEELTKLVEKEYPNVWFYDKTATTAQDIEDYIKKVEEQTGEKVKLVVIDYFERVHTDMKDENAATKNISSGLQDIVNSCDVAMITLVQPRKGALGGGVSSPLLDLTAIKGSSHIYQAFRQVVSLYRIFYSPETADQDKYITFSILKNDLGGIGTETFNWDGARGLITPMTERERFRFETWKRELEESKEEDGNDGWH